MTTMCFSWKSSTPGEIYAIYQEFMTDMNSPRTGSTPGEMCAVELDSVIIVSFSPNNVYPG